MKPITSLFLISLFLPFTRLQAGSATNDTLAKAARFYAGFTHQHQNVYGKAFSLQGIEAGLIGRKGGFLALYGATFVSVLATEKAGTPLFIYLGQYGLLMGIRRGNPKRVHAGALLSTGCFSLVGSRASFELLHPRDLAVNCAGFVVSPQVYGQTSLTGCLQLRVGVGYSMYVFDKQPLASPADVQNWFISFGFLLGKVTE